MIALVAALFRFLLIVPFTLRAGVFPQKTPAQIVFFNFPVGPVRRFLFRADRCWRSRRRRPDGQFVSAAQRPGETPHPGADNSETCQSWSRLVKVKLHRQKQHSQQTAALLLAKSLRLCKE